MEVCPVDCIIKIQQHDKFHNLQSWCQIDHFVAKLLEMKSTHPEAEVLAKYLRAVGDGTLAGSNLDDQVHDILKSGADDKEK